MNVNGIGSARSDIAEMLSKIREFSNKTPGISGGSSVSAPSNFESVMSEAKGVFSKVNDIQTQSDQIRNSYVSGDNNVSMSQVVVASQKSKLAFEGLVAVRNKILEAYREIMNMQV